MRLGGKESSQHSGNSESQPLRRPGVKACNYHPSSRKVEGGPEIQGHPPLHSKFEVSLGVKYKRAGAIAH